MPLLQRISRPNLNRNQDDGTSTRPPSPRKSLLRKQEAFLFGFYVGTAALGYPGERSRPVRWAYLLV